MTIREAERLAVVETKMDENSKRLERIEQTLDTLLSQTIQRVTVLEGLHRDDDTRKAEREKWAGASKRFIIAVVAITNGALGIWVAIANHWHF